MTLFFGKKAQIVTTSDDVAAQLWRSSLAQELQQKIHAALQTAKDFSPDDCLKEIEKNLLAIQRYCKTCQNKFIVVVEEITCDQYELGGSSQDTATLFRVPERDDTIAICVTAKGSLLRCNDHLWMIYRNAGDVDPLSQ